MSAFFIFHNKLVRNPAKLARYKDMIEFPSLERATAWYRLDDYKDLKTQRLSAVDSDGILMIGLDETS